MSEFDRPTGEQDLKPVAQVVDPSMSAQSRDRLVRKIKRSDSEAADDAVGCGFFLTVIGTIPLLVLHFSIGLSWWWMLASAIPIATGIALTPALGGKLSTQDHSLFVRASNLDELSREHMFRTQRAIRDVLKSRVYANNSLDQVVNESALRRHEWEIAIALRKISELRFELKASTKDSEPGPVTAQVLESQRHALMLATNATTSRIYALERYAKEIEMADAAERDWRAAVKASDRNDQYLDLIARTAADEHAITEIQGWTEQASAAAQVFGEHLHQASLAAESLNFPSIPKIDDLA